MASPTQLTQFTFAAGIDQSIRDEVLDPSAGFDLIQNARQPARGALGHRKGFTYQTLERLDATDRSAGYKLFAHGADGKQTCVLADDYLDVYSTSASVNIPRGRVPPFGLSYLKVPGLGALGFSDAVICGNYWVASCRSNLDIVACVIDAATGELVRAPEVIYSASTVESFALLATYGTTVVLIGREVGSADVKWSYIDTASAATINTGWSAAANLRTDGCVVGLADIAFSVESFSDHVALVYGNDSAGTNRLTVMTVDSTGMIDAATINTSSANPENVAIQGIDGDTMWVAWNRASNIWVQAFTTGAVMSTTATQCTVVGYSSALTSWSYGLNNIAIVTTATATASVYVNDQTFFRWGHCVSAAGVVSSAGTADYVVPNVYMASRPFRSGGRTYAMMAVSDSAGAWQKVAVVADVTDSASTISGGLSSVRPVASVEPGLASPPGMQCRAAAYGSEFWIPVSIATSGASSVLTVARLKTSDTQAARVVQRGQVSYILGAIVSQFDGQRVFEAAFVTKPPQPTTSLGGTGITGTYIYVAVYEHVDAAGNWCISGVSTPSASVSPANKTVTVTLPTLGLTGKQSIQNDQSVRITLYRNTSNGTVYYKVSSAANNLAATTVTFTDATADATLIGNAKLYGTGLLPGTNGAAQDRRAPSGLMHGVMYNGMLVGAIGENLRWSGQDIGGEALWWSPLFDQTVSGEGDITGLATADGTVYAFKRRAIYAASGEAPSDNGATGGMGYPRRLGVDVGCIDNRSIVATSLGIFFQSERGIEILTRAQNVEFIGERIRDSLGTATVQAATLDAAAGLVYFELSSGTALVYDLTRTQWQSVDTRDNGAAVSAAIIWDGSAYRYAYLQADGRVRPEQDTYVDDPGTGSVHVMRKVRTGWVKLGGIQGRHIINRVLLLSQRNTSEDTSIALAYDYDASFETATTWTAAVTDPLATSLARVQLGHDAHDNGEGQAIRVEIQDGDPSGGPSLGTGQGHTWIALTFEGAARPNAAEVPEEAR